MVTKNKRKYQNKPVQRSSSAQNYSTKPKYKSKKEQFLKSTLPALVLLLLFVFWTLASIFVFVDKFGGKRKDSAMITASAAEGDLVYSASLDGLRGMYYYDDFTYISMDNASISFTYNTIGRVSVIEFYLGQYSVSFQNLPVNIQCDFFAPADSLEYSSWLTVTTLYNGLSYIDENFILDSIQYGQRLPSGIVVDFIFLSVTSGNTALVEISIDSVDEYDLKLPNYYTQYVGENQALINNLRLEIARLQEQIEVNASIIATKNAEIESLQIDLESNADLILQLQADIESLEEDNELLQTTIQGAYSRGYDAGQANGYETGYNEGQSSGNTFYRLISATIDVPIKAFTGLFDWNLLGINLKQFFLSILSLMAILAAVKLIMR